MKPPPHPLSHHAQEDRKRSGNGSGIDDVSPSPSNQNRSVSLTWEIVGNIKSSPEDFIVREIGWAPPPPPGVECNDAKTVESKEKEMLPAIEHSSSKYKRVPGWTRRIASLECEFRSASKINATDPAGKVAVHVKEEAGDILPASPTKKSRTEQFIEAHMPSIVLQSKPHSAAFSQSINDRHSEIPIDANPMKGLRRIIIRCGWNNNQEQESQDDTGDNQAGEIAADAIFKKLEDLQNLALKEIDCASRPAASDAGSDKKDGGNATKSNMVWISAVQLFETSPTSHIIDGKEDWKLLHRYLRQAFPLLRTESSSVGPSNQGGGEGNDHDNGTKSWVCVLIDETFYPIASCLAKPLEDLPMFYKFRNYGPTPTLREGGNNGRAGHNKYRNRRKNGKQTEQPSKEREKEENTPKTNDTSNQGVVLLRLRPDLPRSERRVIHQSLSSSRRREFDTSTKHDVQLDYADKDSKQTVAVVVQWSRNAIQASQKKRKRSDVVANDSNDQTERKSDISMIFCVLRKYQCEHQVAIKNLVQALKCRSGDLGLAGIKDMQAITYQFCTLRNVGMEKVKRANDSLGKRVQLSNFVDVQGADALLDRGKLLGNRFVITIRNMKRVQRLQVEGEEAWKEQTIPLHSSHIDAMVKRIYDNGFVNFFGEQRVGVAGSGSFVGIRSFDIGAALLKQDFSKAIDLIMTGRSTRVYSPCAEEIHAREVWKKTGGDARLALNAFPKNRNKMVQERDLMKGILRYNDALEAIRCVPYSARTFSIHAYQSYVFNRVATERIRRWGLRPVVGDLYITGGNDGENGTAVDVQVVKEPESVEIGQIVLPLPGYKVQYPSNEMGELYKEILQEDGVELRKGSIPESTAKGSYRKLIQRANRLKWDMVPDEVEDQHDESEDPVVSVARLTFELESGCYATMMLRELMITTMSRDTKTKH